MKMVLALANVCLHSNNDDGKCSSAVQQHLEYKEMNVVFLKKRGENYIYVGSIT
jgi:hypothetical protein